MAKKYEKIVIRKTNGLEIVFINPTTVYVKHRYGINIYERWFVKQRGFYSSNFRPFSESIKYNRYIDLAYINKLAERYEMSVTGSSEMPDLTGQEIREIPEWGRSRNVH